MSGNTALTLVNAKANGLNYVKLFGACEQRNLPSEYTQIKSLKSDGRQFIDTGFIADSDIVTYKFKLSNFGTASHSSLFGSEKSTSGPYSCVPYRTGEGFYYIYIGNASGGGAIDNTDVEYEIEINNNTITIYRDGSPAAPLSFNGSIKTDLSVYLFANHDDVSGAIQKCDCGYEYFQVYKNGLLELDLIPCRRNSDNVLGMYDLVSGNFLTNQGTGTFTAGANTTPSPDTPVDIVSNNGALKVRINLVNTANSTKGQYISSQGMIRSSVKWATSDYLPVIAGGKVTVSGLTRASSSAGFNYYDASKNKVSTIPYETGTHTYTVPNNASYIMITYRWDEDESTVKVYVGETLNAPYTDGTTETVNVHGKNLLDNNQKIIASANLWRYLSTAETGGGIILKAGTSYTLSTDEDVYLYFYNYTTQTSLASGRQKTTYTPTTDVLVYIQAYSAEGIPESTLVQLELGSTATEYEPYFNGGSATAEMLLSVDDYKDEQEVLTGAVTRNVGVKVLDGSETVVKNASTTAPLGYYFGVINTNKPHIVDSNGYCSHFTNTRNSSAALSDNTFAFGSSRRIWFATSKFTKVSDFQQFLADQYAAGQPVILVYPLAEPTTESVAGQALTTQAGTNIVEITQASIDNLALEVSYKGKQ